MHIATPTPARFQCHEARPDPHAGVRERTQGRSGGCALGRPSWRRQHRVAHLCRATVRRLRSDRELPDDDDDDDAVDALASQSRRSHLLAYVEAVQPAVLDSFSTQASPEVLDAMRHTVTNLVGSLPPQVCVL